MRVGWYYHYSPNRTCISHKRSWQAWWHHYSPNKYMYFSQKKLTSVVAPLFTQQIHVFLTKEVDKRGGKMIVAHFRHCRRVFWMLCTRQSCLLALRSSLCSWRLSLDCLTSLICANKNNGNKFYHRKSMQAVDEKLIINELGPYALCGQFDEQTKLHNMWQIIKQ